MDQVTATSPETTRSTNDLPLSKLRGLPAPLRVALKAKRITTCEQLLQAAGIVERRRQLLAVAAIDADDLMIALHRADLARIDGLGAVFGMILEELEIATIAALAAEDPVRLHARVRDYNRQERISRRSPTPEEVAHWVAQARQLPAKIEDVRNPVDSATAGDA